MSLRRICFLLTFGLSLSTFAQTSGSWTELRQLHGATAVKVATRTSGSVHGNFISASESALILRVGDGERTLARADIVSASVRQSGHRARNTLIGAGAGIGVGLLYCGAAGNSILGCRDTTPRSKGWLVSMGFFGAIGAILGALLPSGRWHLLYRAP
ncbi:MAG TPA: hypothetical protein VN709_04555 [Terriglobales bacterium]|nr:hypothetical protein [Terriglobales bacterium]